MKLLFVVFFLVGCGAKGFDCTCTDATGADVSGLEADGLVCDGDPNGDPISETDATAYMEADCATLAGSDCTCTCPEVARTTPDDGGPVCASFVP